MEFFFNTEALKTLTIHEPENALIQLQNYILDIYPGVGPMDRDTLANALYALVSGDNERFDSLVQSILRPGGIRLITLWEYEARYFDPNSFDFSYVMLAFGWEHVLANAYHTLAVLRLAVNEGRNTPANADFQFVANLKPIFDRFGAPITNPWEGAAAGTEFQAQKEEAIIFNTATYEVPAMIRAAAEAGDIPLQTVEETILAAQQIVMETGTTAIMAALQASSEVLQEQVDAGLISQEQVSPVLNSIAASEAGAAGSKSWLLWAGVGVVAFIIFRPRGR